MKYPYPQGIPDKWEPIERRLKTACCHCGLCHIFDFQVRKGKLWMKVNLDPPATRKTRRAKVYPCRKSLDAKAKRVRS